MMYTCIYVCKCHYVYKAVAPRRWKPRSGHPRSSTPRSAAYAAVKILSLSLSLSTSLSKAPY